MEKPETGIWPGGYIMNLNSLLRVGFGVVALAAVGLGAPGTIGVVTAVGTFDINQVRVDGNSNLANGSSIHTDQSASQVLLQNGQALTLGVNSTGQVYGDRLVLQDGATKVDNMDRYSIQADKYLIRATQPNSRAVVKMDAGEVQVAALGGSLDVLNEKGLLLTRIGAGTASAFNRGGGNGSNRPGSDNNNRPRQEVLYLILIASLVGLGLAIDALLQNGSGTPTSPGA